MTRIDQRTKHRLSKTVQWVERQFVTDPYGVGYRNHRPPMAWFGYVKDTSGIDHNATGEVWLAEGDSDDPTESTTSRTVANPFMGKLLDGTPVLVVPCSMLSVTNAVPWYVAPFHLSYEGKADATTAAGSTMTFSVWQGGSDTGINLTSVKLPSWTGESMSSGKFGRATWDIVAQSWYIDSKECE